jgi:hypothetical protein
VIEGRSRSDDRFYPTMAVLIAGVVFAGFAPTFYARGMFFDVVALTPAVRAHGVLGTVWVALFAVQAGLVARGREVWHRRLGTAGLVIAAAFVGSGVIVIAALERSHVGEPDATLAARLFTNGAPLAVFAILVAAGIWQRHVAARHKRLLLLATVVLLPAAIGRLFGYLGWSRFNLVAYACFAFANTGFDIWSRRRMHAVSVGGATTLLTIDVATTLWLHQVEG